MAMSMTTTVFDRLKAWVELFSQRDDVETASGRLRIAPPKPSSTVLPDDVRGFAAETSDFSFSYRVKNVEGAGGELFLSLVGIVTDVYLPVPGKGTFERAIELEYDANGTGLAGFLVLQGQPFIAWNVEDPVVFDSFTDYVTQGARSAFATGDARWQRPREPTPLFAQSLPKTTPPDTIKAALIGRGATPDMADALIEWLGVDVVLLLPKS